MRILIVARAFYPANSPRAHRATELAKEFCRQGHDVSVLTQKHLDQADLETKYGLRIEDLGEPAWPEVPVSFRGKSNLILRGLRAFLEKFFSYPAIGWTYRVFRKLPKDKDYDCVISIAAPHSIHWGVTLADIFGRKPAATWIADCGDPFMGQENSGFFTHPAFYFRWVEKKFCSSADWITVPTEGARHGYYPEFQNKLSVIPQGFRFEDYDYLRKIERGKSVARFAYAGHVIQGKRDPRVLIDYLRKSDVEFEFNIFTRKTGLLESSVRGDSRVVVHEFIPRDELLSELARMDFLVNFENVGNRQTPSKLIDYWLCGRPILSLRSFDLDTALVDQFLAGEYSGALKIEEPEQYRIENVVNQFTALIRKSQNTGAQA